MMFLLESGKFKKILKPTPGSLELEKKQRLINTVGAKSKALFSC
jgi:hypothetical protein